MTTHPNAPLTPEGRRRLCERIDTGRPIAHVAAEGGISRATLSGWYKRWLLYGEEGLQDRSSRPESSPNSTPEDIVDMVLQIRVHEKWGPARISAFLAECGDGIDVAPATVHRILVRHGLNKVKDMDRPTGEAKRPVNRYEWDNPGDMIHVDIKKVGRIPHGGGWAVHGQGNDEHRQSKRKASRTGRTGYAYLHSAVDDHSRLAYTEVLNDEKGETAAAFWLRAALFFEAHGIFTIHRCLTDNGSPYRSKAFAEALAATRTRHKRTQPYTPRTNGKVERYNQIMIAEWLYVRAYDSDDSRTEYLADFLNYYNHERPHSALGYKPPATRVPVTTHRVLPQSEGLPHVTAEHFNDEPTLFDEV